MVRMAVALALLTAGATPASALQQTAAEATVQVAETQLAGGDRDGALATAESVVARDPLNVAAHHLIQRILRRHDEAAMLARYQDLARRYPGSAAAQYLYGNALLNASSRSSTAARAQFGRALQLDPTFGWAASIEAAFAQAGGDTNEALRLLQQINPADVRNDVLASAIYADLLRLNGLRDEALRFLEQAVALNPEDPRFLLQLWKMRMRGVEDYAAERAAFAWQVAANRERFLASPQLTAELAEFYRGSAMGDTDGARALWLALANRFPADPEAKNALLRAARLTDDTAARVALYDRVLADYPESPIRYEVYFRMINDLINNEQYDRARGIARGLTSEIDPGRTDVAPGDFEKPTEWGFTLQGIGYAGWFAAAQAKGRAGGRRANVYSVGEVEQPIAPDALAAARAMDASRCNDPRSLRYVAQYLLDSSYHRDLGLRLMERAEAAAAGADPLIELAYGTEELEDTRRDMARELRDMPLYYALAGMTGRAEQMVERMLAELPPRGTSVVGVSRWRTHHVAARVFALAGRWRDAARQHMLAMWEQPSLPRNRERAFYAELDRIYAEIGQPEIRRYEPGRGPRLPVMRAGLAPVEGAASLDAEALGGELLLIVFWATWDDTAIQQVLALDALSLELEDARLSTLAVAVQDPVRVSRSDGLDRFGRFRRDTDLTIPMARAEAEAIERLDLLGVPTTILLDASGRVLARQLGYGVERGDWSRRWRAVVQEELARQNRPRQR